MRARSRRARKVREELLTLPEAARIAGMDEKAFARRVAGGALPHFKDGRVRRIRRADLEAWIESRMVVGERKEDGA